MYLRSTDGNNADDGSTWALAKATLGGAAAAAAAGETIYVSHQHAESIAGAVTITFAGTEASPNIVLCVNDGAEPPTTLATSAVVETTGNNALTITGRAYCYGITFRAAAGGASTNLILGVSGGNLGIVFDNCRLEPMASTYSRIIVTASYNNNWVELRNSVIKFGSTGGCVYLTSSFFRWLGGSLDIASAVPTYLFSTGRGTLVLVEGVDLSGLNGKLFSPPAAGAAVQGKIINCKYHANTAVLNNAITAYDVELMSDIGDSGDTNYKIDHRKYSGSIVTETTIKRTGGASDGTTGFCWNMVSLTTPKFFFPLASPPVAIWNETVGSAKTLTVEIVHDSLTALKDDEIWVEVEYLGTTGFPKSLLVSDRKADIMAAGADQATSTEAWTTTGLTNPNKQKLAVTFTPQEKGPFAVRVMLAKASYTVYVCPKVTVA